MYICAQQAYKEVSDVVMDLEDYGLIKVVAVLRPIITYKKRAKDHHHSSS